MKEQFFWFLRIVAFVVGVYGFFELTKLSLWLANQSSDFALLGSVLVELTAIFLLIQLVLQLSKTLPGGLFNEANS